MNKPHFTAQANAKINLCLRITGRQANGYHTLSSVFQEIELHDILTFSPATDYSFSCNNKTIPSDEQNLCTIAYHKMKQILPESTDLQIHLQKNIPVGAGLGGGSSDAATVIKFLNKHWNIRLPESELCNIANQIGADVAFFIRGKTQLAEGIGDLLTLFDLPGHYTILLVYPNIHISTHWAYQQFDLTKKKEGYKFGCLLESGRIQWELFENQFESVVFPAYPEIGAIKARLQEAGALFAGLSGSGSTVFGIFKNRYDAENTQRLFNTHNTFISTPITQ